MTLLARYKSPTIEADIQTKSNLRSPHHCPYFADSNSSTDLSQNAAEQKRLSELDGCRISGRLEMEVSLPASYNFCPHLYVPTQIQSDHMDN